MGQTRSLFEGYAHVQFLYDLLASLKEKGGGTISSAGRLLVKTDGMPLDDDLVATAETIVTADGGPEDETAFLLDEELELAFDLVRAGRYLTSDLDQIERRARVVAHAIITALGIEIEEYDGEVELTTKDERTARDLKRRHLLN